MTEFEYREELKSIAVNCVREAQAENEYVWGVVNDAISEHEYTIYTYKSMQVMLHSEYTHEAYDEVMENKDYPPGNFSEFVSAMAVSCMWGDIQPIVQSYLDVLELED